MGAFTPIGNDMNSFWSNIQKGTCGINVIKSFDILDYKCKLCSEVKNFDAMGCVEKRNHRKMDKFSQYAMVAAEEAIKNSGLDLENIDKEKLAVVVGCVIGGLRTIEQEYTKLIENGPRSVSPFLVPIVISNTVASNIAIKYGAKGMCTNVVTACATGTDAIGDAFRLIQDGRADIIIAGGSDSSITPLALAGFASLRALSKSEDPLRASIPFDKERGGFIMGEGAGIIILESLEHAEERNAKIYAEMKGYGSTCYAYHITAPLSDGEGVARVMIVALEETKRTRYNVKYHVKDIEIESD